MANGQPQFDGQNAVAGYTLIHRKDGSSLYLKGENLSSDDVAQRLGAASQPPANQGTIGPGPKRGPLDWLTSAQNLTQEGEAANPIQNAVGKAAGFLVGGNKGIGTSKEGMLTNPVIQMVASGPLGEAAAGLGAAKAIPAASGFTPEMQEAAGLEGSTAGMGTPAVPSYLSRGASFIAGKGKDVLQGTVAAEKAASAWMAAHPAATVGLKTLLYGGGGYALLRKLGWNAMQPKAAE
jgi:hypothetical protein